MLCLWRDMRPEGSWSCAVVPEGGGRAAGLGIAVIRTAGGFHDAEAGLGACGSTATQMTSCCGTATQEVTAGLTCLGGHAVAQQCRRLWQGTTTQEVMLWHSDSGGYAMGQCCPVPPHQIRISLMWWTPCMFFTDRVVSVAWGLHSAQRAVADSRLFGRGTATGDGSYGGKYNVNVM